MAKVIYARLFDWLVWRINESICNKGLQKDVRKIGLLDIYGFEVFEWYLSCKQACLWMLQLVMFENTCDR